MCPGDSQDSNNCGQGLRRLLTDPDHLYVDGSCEHYGISSNGRLMDACLSAYSVYWQLTSMNPTNTKDNKLLDKEHLYLGQPSSFVFLCDPTMF